MVSIGRMSTIGVGHVVRGGVSLSSIAPECPIGPHPLRSLFAEEGAAALVTRAHMFGAAPLYRMPTELAFAHGSDGSDAHPFDVRMVGATMFQSWSCGELRACVQRNADGWYIDIHVPREQSPAARLESADWERAFSAYLQLRGKQFRTTLFDWRCDNFEALPVAVNGRSPWPLRLCVVRYAAALAKASSGKTLTCGVVMRRYRNEVYERVMAAMAAEPHMMQQLADVEAASLAEFTARSQAERLQVWADRRESAKQAAQEALGRTMVARALGDRFFPTYGRVEAGDYPERRVLEGNLRSILSSDSGVRLHASLCALLASVREQLAGAFPVASDARREALLVEVVRSVQSHLFGNYRGRTDAWLPAAYAHVESVLGEIDRCEWLRAAQSVIEAEGISNQMTSMRLAGWVVGRAYRETVLTAEAIHDLQTRAGTIARAWMGHGEDADAQLLRCVWGDRYAALMARAVDALPERINHAVASVAAEMRTGRLLLGGVEEWFALALAAH